MKIIAYLTLIFLVIFVQGLSDEQLAKIQEFNKECLTSSEVNPETVRLLKDGKFPEDSKLNDFLFCFFQKLGFMNVTGELQLDVIKKKLSTELKQKDLLAVLEKCNGVTGKDFSEKAFNVFKCYYDNTPNHVALAF